MSARQKNVLIVPLDWGLGHATRCIPLIKLCIERELNVLIGGTEKTNALLQREFPDLTFLPFNGYNVSYPKKASSFLGFMFKQLPKIQRAIREEKSLTEKYCELHNIDLIISDNRFGVYDPRVRSLFMTHQLNIQLASKKLQVLLRRINFGFIKKFDDLLIPDYENQILSSDLSSYSEQLKMNVHWLGNLSRFKAMDVIKEHKLLVVLSGPEPQRTILESKIITQALHYQISLTLVGGQPDKQDGVKYDGIKYYNHLNGEELNRLFCNTEIIISRTGYTTIMDLVKLERSAILIPTPGQFEQEYLGKYYEQLGCHDVVDQESFDLKETIEIHSNRKKASMPQIDHEQYKLVMNKILDKI